MEPTDVGVTTDVKDLNNKPAVWHPGHIRYACQRDHGSYAGCKLVRFATVEECNSFFEQHGNLTVMDMWVVGSAHERPDVYVLYTNFMTPEEVEEMQFIQGELRASVEKYREDKRKADMETATAEEKEAAEQRRLAEVGKKCEANHRKEKKEKKK